VTVMKPGPVPQPQADELALVVASPPDLRQQTAEEEGQVSNPLQPAARTGAAARRRMQRRHGVAVAARAAVWAKLVGPMMAKAKAAKAEAEAAAAAPIKALLAERGVKTSQAESVRTLRLPARNSGKASESSSTTGSSIETSELCTCVLVVTCDGRLNAFEVASPEMVTRSRSTCPRSASTPPGFGH